MHVPTAPPARGRPGALQKAWLGLAALTALAIPTYWALQTPSLEVEAPAAVVSPLSQRQAAHAAAPSAYAAPSPSVPVPSAGDDPREGDTAADEVGLEQPVALDDRASGDNRAAPPERAKPAKRARPVAAVEPRARAALVADAPGRAAPARDGERRGDELRDMFAPSASRDARPLLPIGSVGANESPILD